VSAVRLLVCVLVLQLCMPLMYAILPSLQAFGGLFLDPRPPVEIAVPGDGQTVIAFNEAGRLADETTISLLSLSPVLCLCCPLSLSVFVAIFPCLFSCPYMRCTSVAANCELALSGGIISDR